MYIFEDSHSSSILNFVSQSEALNFGYSVFETIKVVDKKLEFLGPHLNRLYDSCKILDIPVPPRIEMEDNIIDFSNRKDGDFALKILVAKALDVPIVVISTREITYTPADFKAGFKGCMAKSKRDPDQIINYHKTSNYLTNIFEKKEALKRGFNEPIFLNYHGSITEGATTNIFFLKDQEIITPIISDGLLPGIIRGELLKSKKLNIVERTVKEHELDDFQGAVLTNSLLGVIKLESIDDHTFEDSNRLYELLSAQITG